MFRYSGSRHRRYHDTYYNADQEGYYNSGREGYYSSGQEGDQGDQYSSVYDASSSYYSQPNYFQPNHQQGWGVDYATPGPWRAGYVQWNQGSYSTEEYPNNYVSGGYDYPQSIPTRSYRDFPREAERRAYHTARPPTSSLQRSPPPVPRSPSPSYISISRNPSDTLSSPTASRKLLILDLNGTLLIRAQFGTRPKFGHGPRLRPVHPRPYMPAFRSYLFASETKAWLDVMVWSSAQPHSVTDMVDKCFGKEKEELIAVWARDTLGLSQGEYSRKTQTTKDLAKPWALSLPKEEESTGEVQSDATAQVHSALTTLLLDDSPLKAHLQPYNHVCIKEYVAELRAKDLELVENERRRVLAEEQQEAERKTAEEGSSSSPDVVPEGEGRKRKRAKKKKLKAVVQQEDEGRTYDQTLLAVIGVLDTVKEQSNVAGWIRSGGLWGPAGYPLAESSEVASEVVAEEAALSPSEESPARKDRKRRRRDEADTDHQNSDTVPIARTGNDAETVVPQISLPNGEAGEAEGSAETSAKRSGKKRKQREDVDPENDGVDGTAEEVKEDQAEDSLSPEPVPAPSMWFDNPETMKHWVARGIRALEELGIEVVHGIER